MDSSVLCALGKLVCLLLLCLLLIFRLLAWGSPSRKVRMIEKSEGWRIAAASSSAVCWVLMQLRPAGEDLKDMLSIHTASLLLCTRVFSVYVMWLRGCYARHTASHAKICSGEIYHRFMRALSLLLPFLPAQKQLYILTDNKNLPKNERTWCFK